MSGKLHDVNIALARCDLVRVLAKHLRAGADPGRLLGELLEMCVNLRELAEPVASRRKPDPGVSDRGRLAVTWEEVVGESRVMGHPEFTGTKVRWLRPVAGLLALPRGHHVQREADADEGLAHD